MKARYEQIEFEERESVKRLDGEFDLRVNQNLNFNSESMLTKGSKPNTNTCNSFNKQSFAH